MVLYMAASACSIQFVPCFQLAGYGGYWLFKRLLWANGYGAEGIALGAGYSWVMRTVWFLTKLAVC